MTDTPPAGGAHPADGADHAPVPALDPAIHHPTRLAVAAFLSACDEAEFATVREACEVSASVLSKVTAALENAGYLIVRKGYVGKRPRTWLALTVEGDEALAGHLAALQHIAASARGAASARSAGAARGHEHGAH